MTEDQADRLAALAAQFVGRVRDDDPQANARWLLSVTNDTDRWALLFVLAAAVPDDRTFSELVAWAGSPPIRPRRVLKPCGTHAAFNRHQTRGEEPCQPCRDAARVYNRQHSASKRRDA